MDFDISLSPSILLLCDFLVELNGKTESSTFLVAATTSEFWRVLLNIYSTLEKSGYTKETIKH